MAAPLQQQTAPTSTLAPKQLGASVAWAEPLPQADEVAPVAVPSRMATRLQLQQAAMAELAEASTAPAVHSVGVPPSVVEQPTKALPEPTAERLAH